MPDDRNIQHDKKVINDKKHKGEDLTQGAAHTPQPGKKTAHEKPHGAHKETEAEKSGGSIAETEHDLTDAASPTTPRVTSKG